MTIRKQSNGIMPCSPDTYVHVYGNDWRDFGKASNFRWSKAIGNPDTDITEYEIHEYEVPAQSEYKLPDQKTQNLQIQCMEYSQHAVAANMEVERLRKIVTEIFDNTHELKTALLCERALHGKGRGE